MVSFDTSGFGTIVTELGVRCGEKRRQWKQSDMLAAYESESRYIRDLRFLKELYCQRNREIDKKEKKTKNLSPQTVFELRQSLWPNFCNQKRGFKHSINLPPKGTCLPRSGKMWPRRIKKSQNAERKTMENNTRRSFFQRQNRVSVQEFPRLPGDGSSPSAQQDFRLPRAAII